MDYQNTIHAIVDPIVEDKEAVLIREIPSTKNKDKDITILIAANKKDISRLIGKKGVIASAIRELVSVSAKKQSQHVHIRFESYDEGEKED